ncbi:hypothetical protein V2J09_000523 [Rumex salicifolius]
MDGREGMTLSGSASYYLHNGIGGGDGGSSGGGAVFPAFSSQNGFENLTNPNIHQLQSNFSVVPSLFNVEGSPAVFSPHGFSVTVPPASAPGGSGGVDGGALGGIEPAVKKKRGRPRKYSPPDESATVPLVLSPSSSTPNSNSRAEKRKRGRPPGSGRKQRLASVGEWMSTSAGVAFTPHVIYVAPGEDIASKVLSFSQQRQRALCIMSASGGVSAVTLHQPASSVGNVTYEGRFEILCLSGSYLVADTGGARNRTGGVNVSLASPDGQVIGGSVAGRLIAARPSQVIVCSFLYGNHSQKLTTSTTKSDSDSKDENTASGQHSGDNTNETPSQHMTPASVGWPASDALHGRNRNTDIDLM